MNEEQAAALAAASFEPAVRARARQIIEMVDTAGVDAPEYHFDVDGIPVRMLRTNTRVILEIGEASHGPAFRLALPAGWLTNDITIAA